MPPINLYNYHLLGDGKPHSKETANRASVARVVKNPREFMRGR